VLMLKDKGILPTFPIDTEQSSDPVITVIRNMMERTLHKDAKLEQITDIFGPVRRTSRFSSGAFWAFEVLVRDRKAQIDKTAANAPKPPVLVGVMQERKLLNVVYVCGLAAVSRLNLPPTYSILARAEGVGWFAARLSRVIRWTWVAWLFVMSSRNGIAVHSSRTLARYSG